MTDEAETDEAPDSGRSLDQSEQAGSESPFSIPGFILSRDTLLRQSQIQVWQGQFPPPEAMERYEQIQPGAFDRIIVMAERQQEAQNTLQLTALKAASGDARRGHWLGAAIAGLGLAGAIACVWLHQPWVAGLMVALPVMSVAKALIDSTRANDPESVSDSNGPPQRSDHSDG